MLNNLILITKTQNNDYKIFFQNYKIFLMINKYMKNKDFFYKEDTISNAVSIYTNWEKHFLHIHCSIIDIEICCMCIVYFFLKYFEDIKINEYNLKLNINNDASANIHLHTHCYNLGKIILPRISLSSYVSVKSQDSTLLYMKDSDKNDNY